MNVLDEFLNQRNAAILLQCLGENISINFNNSNNNNNNKKEVTGIFVSTNLNDIDSILIQEDNLMSNKKIIDISNSEEFEFFKIKNINLNVKKPMNEIKTDCEVGRSLVGYNNNNKSSNIKELVEYKLDENLIDSKMQFNLEDDNTNFNQFELNKEKFNVTSTYSELNYTTPLDYNKVPKELVEKAIKIENELTSNTAHSNNLQNNRHIQEERGLIKQREADDEEDEYYYSAVYRTNK